MLSIPNHLTSETIDDETITVDLEKGHYYSLEGTASFIWRSIENGLSLESISNLLSNHYELPKEKIENDLQIFTALLQKENLLLDNNLSEKNSENSLAITPNTTTYTPPVFNKYTDMEELLILDPIHETDEQGWPHQPIDK